MSDYLNPLERAEKEAYEKFLTQQAKLDNVYNRLQAANKGIAELVKLLDDCDSCVTGLYLPGLSDKIDAAIKKYGHINGD